MTAKPLLLLAVAAALAARSAAADPPESLFIFPLGGQRGTAVDVRIGGMHLHDECPLALDAADGLTAPATIRRTERVWFEGPVIPKPESQQAENYPNDYAARFTIAADARLGTRWWRVSTSQGVTPSRRFVVGDLPEVVEREIDGTAIPVPVTLPVTVNGRIFPREDVDEWSFHAAAGETIRCEVAAARLGSPLDSQLEILDAAGRRLEVNSDHHGPDSLIVFTAPADGEYRARIFDAAYGGLQTHVYRLTISSRPHVTTVHPLGGRRGTTTSFTVAGIDLPQGSQAIAIPADAAADHPVRFAAGAGGLTDEVLLETGDAEELLETEGDAGGDGNDEPGDAVPLPAAAAVANGRIGRPGDVDHWAFSGMKGGAVSLDLHAALLDSPLDGVLTVIDTTGRELATSDDRGPGSLDPRLFFTPPADGRYVVRIADRSPRRGGPRFSYRLHVGPPPEAAFGLTLSADAVTIDRGGTAKLKLSAWRGPGADADLAVVIDDLPTGVTVTGEKIPKGRDETTLSLAAAADAPLALAACRVRLVAKTGDTERSVGGGCAVRRGETPLDRLHLRVALPTPFTVVGESAIPYAASGTHHVKRFRVVRNGFAGPLTVRLAEKQMRHLQGVEGPTVIVPAGTDEFDYPVFLPTWMELSRTCRAVVTAVGEASDEQGGRHQVCFTSAKPSEQISLIVVPGPLTVRTEAPAVVAAVAEPTAVGLRIDRGAGMTGPVRVELVVPPHIGGVTAAPVVIPPDSSGGRLELRFTADAGPWTMPLVVRATHGTGLDRVVAESPLEIVATD